MIIKIQSCFPDEIIRRFSFLLQFHIFITLSGTTVFAQQPLIFDPFTLKIYNPLNSTDMDPKIPFAAACPAQNPSEEKMNEHSSIDYKALFVQYYGVSKSQLDNLKTLTCSKKFEMAAAYSRKHHTIEFGYEIYFKKVNVPELPQPVSTSSYSNYRPISEAGSVRRKMVNRWIKRPSSPSLGKGPEKELGFTWIPRVILQYDARRWRFLFSEYTIHHEVAEYLTIECNNYNLGYSLYEKERMLFDEFYSLDRQKKIFATVKSSELPESSICKTEGKCVKKYDFLKPYLFRSSYGSPVSCSNLATIPIWFEVVEELLNNLEIFLFALGQVTENPLTIIPGVSGILSLETTDYRRIYPKDMYLYQGMERLSVPKIIYKIVGYKSHDCEKKGNLCWFYMVIVIQNHPGPVKDHMICPKDLCEYYGWEKIKFINRPKQGQGSEYIYCCQLDDAIMREIGFESYIGSRETLNLKKFPVYDKKLGDIRREDRQTDVETKMDQLQKEVLEILKTKSKN